MGLYIITGADPGFFLGGGALVSCSTSTPINHIVLFLQNTSCIRKPTEFQIQFWILLSLYTEFLVLVPVPLCIRKSFVLLHPLKVQ